MQHATAVRHAADAPPAQHVPTTLSTDTLTWGPDDVAAALGLRPAAFRAQRQRLEAAGFPRPLPVLRSRWSIEAVRAWIALAGTEG